MLPILCFLNSLCYQGGQPVQTPIIGIVRSIGYDYTFKLSGNAVITLDAQLENYNQPYLLYYKTFDTPFTYFDHNVIFNLSVLNTEVDIIAKNGDNILAFKSFKIP